MQVRFLMKYFKSLLKDSDRTCTGVLCSHPLSWDIRVSLSLSLSPFPIDELMPVDWWNCIWNTFLVEILGVCWHCFLWFDVWTKFCVMLCLESSSYWNAFMREKKKKIKDFGGWVFALISKKLALVVHIWLIMGKLLFITKECCFKLEKMGCL